MTPDFQAKLGAAFKASEALQQAIAELQSEWAANDALERREDKTTPQLSEPEKQCERCAGNGEVVTDWRRYLEGMPDDTGDEGTEDCPDCDGRGTIADLPEETVGLRGARQSIERLAKVYEARAGHAVKPGVWSDETCRRDAQIAADLRLILSALPGGEG